MSLWTADDVMAKYEASSAGKKRIAFAKRAKTTDFERFQVMLARKGAHPPVAAPLRPRAPRCRGLLA